MRLKIKAMKLTRHTTNAMMKNLLKLWFAIPSAETKEEPRLINSPDSMAIETARFWKKVKSCKTVLCLFEGKISNKYDWRNVERLLTRPVENRIISRNTKFVANTKVKFRKVIKNKEMLMHMGVPRKFAIFFHINDPMIFPSS